MQYGDETRLRNVANWNCKYCNYYPKAVQCNSVYYYYAYRV